MAVLSCCLFSFLIIKQSFNFYFKRFIALLGKIHKKDVKPSFFVLIYE